MNRPYEGMYALDAKRYGRVRHHKVYRANCVFKKRIINGKIILFYSGAMTPFTINFKKSIK